MSKDGTKWFDGPVYQARTLSRNILRQRPGPANFSALFTAKETFKSTITPEMCDIILRETNRKGKRVTSEYNNKLAEQFPDAEERTPSKEFQEFTEEELDAFFGILIAFGVHKSNKEHIDELWKLDSLPLIRETMSLNQFKTLLSFIRFDNNYTHAKHVKNDKAVPIRDLWTMLNSILEKGYRPSECTTVDDQLFGYKGQTKFTQYIPSKPKKYGTKTFWTCDTLNSYPLQDQIYTGKPADG